MIVISKVSPTVDSVCLLWVSEQPQYSSKEAHARDSVYSPDQIKILDSETLTISLSLCFLSFLFSQSVSILLYHLWVVGKLEPNYPG